MMQTNVLLEWLTQTPTLITVVGPAVLFAVGFVMVPAWRIMATKLLLIALVLAPVSLSFSWWVEDGLYVFTPFALVYICLMWTNKLDIRRHWFAVMFGIWVSALLPDALGSWTSFEGHTYFNRAWYWGIGGHGVADGLVLYPAYFLPILLGCQEVLRRGWFRMSVVKAT